MHLLARPGLYLAPIGWILAFCVACAPNQSPDQLREKTAQATETAKRDTQAVVEGVKEGLASKKAVDLNKASKDELLALPEITSQKADRIIAERPFASTRQLVSRHILSEDEYAHIRERVIITR
ncbi:MAG TPA: helix-hairpin-helix domain-containing protein [Candidatus Sulfotelmatobacter sp.]